MSEDCSVTKMDIAMHIFVQNAKIQTAETQSKIARDSLGQR